MNDTPIGDQRATVDLPCEGANPVLVEVARGSLVESRHRGSVVVVDLAGKVTMPMENCNGRVVGAIRPSN